MALSRLPIIMKVRLRGGRRDRKKEVKSMETVLAILMVLGIFLVAPMVIGFAIAGVYILRARRAHRRKPAPTTGEILATT